MNTLVTSITIGALAAEASVNVETIRFYQRKGLMQEPGRQQGKVRRYGPRDLGRVRFIKSAQRLGFSLDGIRIVRTGQSLSRRGGQRTLPIDFLVARR